MKKLMFSLVLFGSVLLVGCSHSESPHVIQANYDNLKTDGTLVGITGDGLEVRRWEIEMGND